jgi:hypothetical protein
LPRDRIELPTRGFSIGHGGANGREPSDPTENWGADATARDRPSLINPHSSHDGASPKARIVASMSEAMVAALDAADPEAARSAHDAIGRLLRGHQGGGEASPRARMATMLAASVAEAMAVGDLEAARIAHDAIGRLLREGASKDGAEVVDLAGRRTPKK